MDFSRSAYRVVLHSRSLGSFTIRESERVGAADLIHLADSLTHPSGAFASKRVRCVLEDGSEVWLDPGIVEWAQLFNGQEEVLPEVPLPDLNAPTGFSPRC